MVKKYSTGIPPELLESYLPPKLPSDFDKSDDGFLILRKAHLTYISWMGLYAIKKADKAHIYDLDEKYLPEIEKILDPCLIAIVEVEEMLKSLNINNFNKFFPNHPLLRGAIAKDIGGTFTFPYKKVNYADTSVSLGLTIWYAQQAEWAHSDFTKLDPMTVEQAKEVLKQLKIKNASYIFQFNAIIESFDVIKEDYDKTVSK